MSLRIAQKFQFHEGTIKTYKNRFKTEYLYSFNSIKVRLRRDPEVKLAFLQSFQFHKGTIKTIFNSELYYNPSLFQFHKGTIKT